MIRLQASHSGALVVDQPLGHGEDPESILRAHGWEPDAVTAAGTGTDLLFSYAVRPTVAQVTAPPAAGPGLSVTQRALAHPRRRVAAYAVVVEDGRLLLTELSDQTEAHGMWTLPGGGVDADEEPRDAVVREVFEETGQSVTEVVLALVTSMHWLGVSRTGPEDYHAIRLIHRARCHTVAEPIVHDVGGSTSAAAWVPLSEVSKLSLVSTAEAALSALSILGD